MVTGPLLLGLNAAPFSVPSPSSIRTSQLKHERLHHPVDGSEDAHSRPRYLEERPRTGSKTWDLTVLCVCVWGGLRVEHVL